MTKFTSDFIHLILNVMEGIVYRHLTHKKKKNGEVSWILAKMNLYDYIGNLKRNFFDYDIQRRIVPNLYLDKIWETVLRDDFIPSITLTTTDKAIETDFSKDENLINLSQCEIIDGLQRTYRLWSLIYLEKVLEKIQSKSADEIIQFIRDDVTYGGNKLFNLKILSRKNLKTLLENNHALLAKYIEAYRSFDIIINIWVNLSQEEIIRKMLTLNAGQKGVTSTHQFELLFLHFFESLELPKDVQLLREKDPDYFKIKNGNDRKTGQFLMSSVVIALQSYIQGKPLRISQVNKINIDDFNIDENDAFRYFTKQNLEDFVRLIYGIDQKFLRNKELANWLMKDTTLSGIFSALGNCNSKQSNFDNNSLAYKKLNDLTPANIDKVGFDKSYNQLSSVKLNVGNAVRKAVYNYFLNMFEGNKSYSWSQAFNNYYDEEE